MAQGRRLLVAGCEKMEGQLFKGFVWMPGTAACTRVRPDCQRVDMRRAIESPSSVPLHQISLHAIYIQMTKGAVGKSGCMGFPHAI